MHNALVSDTHELTQRSSTARQSNNPNSVYTCHHTRHTKTHIESDHTSVNARGHSRMRVQHVRSPDSRRAAKRTPRAMLATLVFAVTASSPVHAIDPRSMMHGIAAVPTDDGYNVFFSSSGIPPTGADANGDWTHDVYRALWRRSDDNIGSPELFIRKPEAQEPVSAARTHDGHIMVTVEDGWKTSLEVNQRYGVYGSRLEPIAPYPRNVAGGGHSGDVVAVGNRFVVAYSEGWINGNGLNNAGSGYGIYARIYDSNGNPLKALSVAPRQRAWWPTLAASSHRAVILWQRFVPDRTYASLRYAVLNPATGDLSPQRTLHPFLKYYSYQIAFVPAINRFLIIGTNDRGKGFAYLINPSGGVTAHLACMPATVREASITVVGNKAYFPVHNNRLLHLELAPAAIQLHAIQASPVSWAALGSVGLIRDAAHLHWVSLTTKGIEEGDVNLNAATPPTAADRCFAPP